MLCRLITRLGRAFGAAKPLFTVEYDDVALAILVIVIFLAWTVLSKTLIAGFAIANYLHLSL